MQVTSVNSGLYSPKFKGNKNGYENPINRKSEKKLAIWGAIGGSSVLGATAAGLTTCLTEKGSKYRGWKISGIGIAAALAYLAITLPAKLYNTKVNAFAREKEMDVFSRDRDLKSNIMEEVNKEVKDEDVDLDQKINHYTSVQMANKGNGMIVKGA